MKKIQKLFFVEDDPLFLRVYIDFFSKEGFEVETADNGLKALGKLESMEKLPSLIVIDMMMPEMNGLEFLRVAKSNPRYKRIPVIMLTNLNSQSDVEQAYILGAILYLVKTDYSPKEVVGKIKEILSAYKNESSVHEVSVPVKDLPEKKADSPKPASKTSTPAI